jgi:hypothetical protein
MPPKKTIEKKGGRVYAKNPTTDEELLKNKGFPRVSISHIKR